MRRVSPMIRVRDVAATVGWYRALGFELVDANEEDGALDWAMLSFGDSSVMFNAGGGAATGDRREVDLYVHADGIDALHERLRGQVDLVERPHDTFYGMREFIVRDPDGFWVTFGEQTEASAQGR